MKPHVADWQSRVYCVRIEPVTGAPILLAGYPVPLVMSNGAVYQTENGYEFSGIAGESTFASSSVDLEGIIKAGYVTRESLADKVYDNARVFLFATSWTNPQEDEEPLAMMFWGKVDLTDQNYKVELMGSIDVLSQSIGRNYTYTCPWTFADRQVGSDDKIPAHRSRCSGPRSSPDGPNFTTLLQTVAITSATDQDTLLFNDLIGFADDYFGNGAMRFITGQNAGLSPIGIRSSAAGVITLIEPLRFVPAPGDMAEILPGCRKRPSDCSGKWGNIINFGGMPNVPTPTQYNQIGRN